MGNSPRPCPSGLEATRQPGFPGNLPLTCAPSLASPPRTHGTVHCLLVTVADILRKLGGGGGDGGGGEGVTAPSLPSEGVPDHQQAVGPSVSRGDPPPVLADAHAGDHVGVALRKPGGSSFKTWRMQPSPGIGRKDWGPAESRAPSPTHRAGNSTSRRQVPYVVATCLGPRHNSEC